MPGRRPWFCAHLAAGGANLICVVIPCLHARSPLPVKAAACATITAASGSVITAVILSAAPVHGQNRVKLYNV